MWKKSPIKLVNHTEQHQIGVDSFDKLYHLENSWIKVDEKLNNMMTGRA